MAVSVLRVPPAPVSLDGDFDFEEVSVKGVPLAVDAEARRRISSAAAVAQSGASAAEAIPYLIEMLDQDRISGAGNDLVDAFSSGGATSDDGRRVENMARIGEADLACQIAAQDALAAIGATAVPALVEALRHPNNNRRIGAAKALGGIGVAAEPALAILERLVKDDSSELVRKAAADALKLVKPRRRWLW